MTTSAKSDGRLGGLLIKKGDNTRHKACFLLQQVHQILKGGGCKTLPPFKSKLWWGL